MKNLEEIKASRRVLIGDIAEDGFRGEIHLSGWMGSVIASHGAGWEHVSVSPYKKSYTPSWDDMVTIKNIFFHDNEAVIQVHPPKAEYVNNMPNCLHLWRCTYKNMVLPPSCLVGIRKGQTLSELKQELKEAYEMAGETYE